MTSTKREPAIGMLIGTVLLISGCAWNETSRVDTDFGNSVRNMVAEQIFDPEVAHDPPILGPSTLPGYAAKAAVDGQSTAASEARVQRERSERSPIPVTGVTSGADD